MKQNVVTMAGEVQGDKMKITKIYKDIQKFGKLQGTAAIFIDVYGCSVKCSFCSSGYSNIKGQETETKEFQNILPYQIADECSNIRYATDTSVVGIEWIIFSGGEPAEQTDLKETVEILQSRNFKVGVLTSGTAPLPRNLDYVNVSPKPCRKWEITVPLAYIDDFAYVVTSNFNATFIQEGWRKLFKDKIYVLPNEKDYDLCYNICRKLVLEDPRLRLAI